MSGVVNRIASSDKGLGQLSEGNASCCKGMAQASKTDGHRRPARIGWAPIGAGCREVDADVTTPVRRGKPAAPLSLSGKPLSLSGKKQTRVTRVTSARPRRTYLDIETTNADGVLPMFKAMTLNVDAWRAHQQAKAAPTTADAARTVS